MPRNGFRDGFVPTGYTLTPNWRLGDISQTPMDELRKWMKTEAESKKTRERKRMEELAALEKQGIKRTMMYGGAVQLDFKNDSSKYRYVVTDLEIGLVKKSVRGVTGTIGDVLDKPGLRTWPMNMSHAYLFGSTWVTVNEEDGSGEWQYNPKTAALKPDTGYTAEQLQEHMVQGTKQWTKRSDRGKDIGHLVHSACEMYLRKSSQDPVTDVLKEVPDISDDDAKAVAKAFRAFADWWSTLPNPTIIGIEMPVYSRQLQYAGTFDLAVEINGKSILLDIKTTNRGREAPLGIYPEMFIQLGAYSYAYREEKNHSFDDVGIVNVGKDGRLSLATASDMNIEVSECERAFAFACRLHDWVEQIKPLTKEKAFKSSLYFDKDKEK